MEERIHGIEGYLYVRSKYQKAVNKPEAFGSSFLFV